MWGRKNFCIILKKQQTFQLGSEGKVEGTEDGVWRLHLSVSPPVHRWTLWKNKSAFVLFPLTQSIAIWVSRPEPLKQSFSVMTNSRLQRPFSVLILFDCSVAWGMLDQSLLLLTVFLCGIQRQTAADSHRTSLMFPSSQLWFPILLFVTGGDFPITHPGLFSYPRFL